MPSALADLADVEGRLGRPFREGEHARVLLLLQDASAMIRGFTGRSFTAGTRTARIRAVDGWISLPGRPVTAVTAVKTVSGATVPFEWDGLHSVRVWPAYESNWGEWSYADSVVDVTYTVGSNTIPDEVRGVCAQIVVRALGRSPEDAGITQESVAGYSYTVGAVGAAGPFGLLPDERAALLRYRQPQASTVMLL